MTMRQKRSVFGVTVAAALGLAVLVITGVAARSAIQPLRIEIVIEQMAFRAPDAANAAVTVDNPTIRVRTGQSVEIVLKSLDRGMKHDLVIPVLGLKVEPVGFGETATVRFTAPSPGTYTYYCTMHPKLMHGELVVTE